MALEIVMPRLSDSMEEGTILQWLVAEGDSVEAGQPLVEVETDKATVTHEADAAGVVLALTVGEGASVPVGAPIALIGEPGEQLRATGSPEAAEAAVGARGSSGGPGPAPAATVGVRGSPATTGPAPRPGRAKASPLARRLAAERGIDLAGLAGSGPDGRVIRADVEHAAAANAHPAAVPRAPASGNGESRNGERSTGESGTGEAGTGEPSTGESGTGEAEVHELSRLQRTVARRMSESRATVPDIELRREVDMGEAAELRARLREVSDPPPSFNDFIVRAVALALREFPRVNGAYRDGTFETYPRVNVGIAVAAEDALMVPTIFDADTMRLAEITGAARTLASRVRDSTITPAELSGATFTVSNLGMYDVDSFSAVINQPQAAILTVGALRPRPVVDEGGAVVARPTVVLALACDHRILYGADGARFLGRVRELLERPLSLLV
ncbi:MAG TPA: dihydrolipoamide acetyltransferase family protein [Solirubrobacteraceae bacterium]